MRGLPCWMAAWLLGGCQLVFPLREPDAMPPGDRDGDSVLDPDDNCPDIPNDQHDEDDDGVGDVCDNCPHLGNQSQDDNGDGDGLGTACDDSLEIDCIVHFDPFTTPVIEDATTIGTWVQVGDAYRQNSMVEDAYLAVDPVPRAQPLIIIGTRVIHLGPTTELSNHGLWFGFDVPGPSGSILAELTSSKNIPADSTTALRVIGTITDHEILVPDVNMLPDSIGELRLDLRGAGAIVSGKLDAGFRMIDAIGVIEPRQIGLRTHRQEAEFAYLLVVQRQPACGPRD